MPCRFFASWVVVVITAIALVSPTQPLRAQAPANQATTSPDPAKLPLVSASDMKYLGAFDVDSSDGTDAKEGSLSYGGRALSVNATTRTLIISGHAWYNRLCEVAIPDDFSRGTRAVQPCADVAEGRLSQLDDGASVELGGSLMYHNRLILAAYSSYDADGSQEKSHFASGMNLSNRDDVEGPFRVGDRGAGFVSGYMSLVPQEWQALLGGPAVTGNCCISIASRTSNGPALSAFNPDDLGRGGSVDAVELLGYPLDDALAAPNTKNLLYNHSTMIRGVALPSGTRSVLFVGRIGEGEYCYGDVAECRDPASIYKGAHMYPYRHQVWAYDALDLAQVKRGKKRPWEVQPYATWKLSEMNDTGSASIAGAAYDQTTRRLYITEPYGEHPKVHVYEIANKDK